jgi:hypothetical protein
MTYRPNHIYMGGMLRQDEFFIAQADEQRIAHCTGIVKS